MSVLRNAVTSGTLRLDIGANASDLTAGTGYTYTAYGDGECKQAIDSVSFTAR